MGEGNMRAIAVHASCLKSLVNRSIVVSEAILLLESAYDSSDARIMWEAAVKGTHYLTAILMQVASVLEEKDYLQTGRRHVDYSGDLLCLIGEDRKEYIEVLQAIQTVLKSNAEDKEKAKQAAQVKEETEANGNGKHTSI
jgi:hypothetical protein